MSNVIKFINEEAKIYDMLKCNSDDLKYVRLFTELYGLEHDMGVTIANSNDKLEICLGIPCYDEHKFTSLQAEEKIIVSDDGKIEYSRCYGKTFGKPLWLKTYEEKGIRKVQRSNAFPWEKFAAMIIEH